MIQKVIDYSPCSRMCINGQVNHQQSGIDAIPDMVSGHLSLDPGLISEVIICTCSNIVILQLFEYMCRTTTCNCVMQ